MKKIILDMDTGIDDAMAIALAISNPNFDILGFTTTFGNVSTKKSVENTLTILSLLNRDDIPVFMGEEELNGNIYTPSEYVKGIHGANGLGNVSFPKSSKSVQGESAVSFISRMIKKYQKELTIVTTGTLTNLASVYKNDPSLVPLTGKVVVMGGALATRGNVSELAEANIYKNIEGAKFVYSLSLDITQIGLDVTEQLKLSKSDINEWRKSERGELFATMVSFYIDYHKTGECFLHDPAAVAYLFDHSLFQDEYFPLCISDEGRTYMDIDRGKRVNVPLHVDKTKAEEVIKKGLSSALML